MSKYLENLRKARPDIYEDAVGFIERVRQDKIKKRTLPNTSEEYPIEVAEASFERLVLHLKNKKLFQQCTENLNEQPS